MRTTDVESSYVPILNARISQKPCSRSTLHVAFLINEGTSYTDYPKLEKSSPYLSITGCFNLDVYVLTISSLNNYNLKTFFAKLPQHRVILLKDANAVSVH
jgi:hypothetical protein